ncbi:MAG TPA: hypothetical protein VJ873_02510, partial [bacterium]|nr:hypothetical protein [bacterium]
MKSNIFNRPLAVLLLSLGSMVCGGCASIMTKPFPDVTSRFNLTVVEQTPLNHQGWPYDDCPPGTYHIEGKNVFVASLQGDENVAGAGAAFGLLGAAIATGDLAGSVKKKVAGSESLLCPDIQGMANECLKEEMEKNPEGARFIYSTAPGNNPILIIPYLVFSFVDDANANLWTVLKVEWRGKEPGG